MDDSDLLGDSGSLDFLEALLKHRVHFMIAGATAALLQGVPLTTQDIDLWFKDLGEPSIKDALDEVNGIYVPPFMHNPPTFAGESVKLFDIFCTPQGLGSFEQEYENAIAIRLDRLSVPVLPLERVIESKRAAGRDKDRPSLPVLENALKVIRQETRFPLWRDCKK